VGPRKTNALFRELLDALDWFYSKRKFKKISVVVDNYKIHDAQAVGRWLAAHPRFELMRLPTYCPEANPIERAFGDVHDKCTRNHKRTKLTELIADVERHVETNGRGNTNSQRSISNQTSRRCWRASPRPRFSNLRECANLAHSGLAPRVIPHNSEAHLHGALKSETT
jgi:hypothetical protein